MKKDKVSKIEFHITLNEVDDFIMRSSELIKDGYSFYSLEQDSNFYITNLNSTEPYIHVVFIKNK